MKYDPTWPQEQRTHAALAMLGQIQLDIPAGRYSEPGRVNCQSVMHVLVEPAQLLHGSMNIAMLKALNFEA